jgi:hypothetical protein
MAAASRARMGPDEQADAQEIGDKARQQQKNPADRKDHPAAAIDRPLGCPCATHGNAHMTDSAPAGAAQHQATSERGQNHQRERGQEADCPNDKQKHGQLGHRQQQKCDRDPFDQ